MTKRRVFDIGFPDDDTAPESVPAGTDSPSRRSPMAAAISENAEALRDRAAAEARIRDENDALAHEFVRLKKLGVVVDLIALDDIHAQALNRDRATGRDEELDELKDSIREIGLSNPIRVVARDGGYDLVQGYRRLTAYRELLAETGNAEAWGRIPAGMVAPGESLEALYRRMVDENMVRRDISFAEMAELARAYAQDPETPAPTLDAAIASLYASANRQKRIYIRNFARMLDGLGASLQHAPAIPRALGLQVWKRMDREPETLPRLLGQLNAEPTRSEDREMTLLRDYAGKQPEEEQGAKTPAPRKPGARTTLRVAHGAEMAQFSASDGRVELRLPRDFTTIDRARLERAVTAFLAVLDDD
ncbi:ParB family chromosome partitioning protein [Roseinatronobacter thiooxidans]|uniref:ParB family chromosome partitioning protein n=1 Tax=Roseinatronobacter thiooxidans TaxID=121821 RepID=A0A2W7QB41_9RHOB|nr:ParB/RepB/Spo0J family partition protein [Roseinatronobacter thiooxidans]PZX38299.1 ParB family chromosome partitioning protein [Roseinatronobacter thiooxidans]